MSLRILQTVDEYDTTEIEVTAADEGKYFLAFLWPGKTGASDDDYFITGNITAGGPDGASSL